jgi:hypothetical protein
MTSTRFSTPESLHRDALYDTFAEWQDQVAERAA